MGGPGPAQPVASTQHATNNTKLVPIIFVPGVMGTRLNISGTTFNWDPNDDAEMSGWIVGQRRRELVRRVNRATRADPATDLDANTNAEQPNVDPRGDIEKRSRLKQIATDKLPKNTNTRAFPGQITVFYKKRGWGEVVWSFYGNLLMDLAERLNPGSHAGEIHPLHVFGYDWRKSNADSGTKLRARIKDVLKEHPAAKQVIVVTHSMGGLVTRAALRQGEGNILGVVHCVIPADGAVVAYRRFFTGASDIAEGKADPLNSILGPNRIEYGLMQSVLGGPMELLPHNSYPEIFIRLAGGQTNRDLGDLFKVYENDEPPGILIKKEIVFDPGVLSPELTTTEEDVENMRESIRSAGRFTDSIRDTFHPRTFLVFGDGLTTDMEVDFTRAKITETGSGSEGIALKRKQGDGTVPRPSAEFRAVKKPLALIGVTGAEHSVCFAAPKFTDHVVDGINALLAP